MSAQEQPLPTRWSRGSEGFLLDTMPWGGLSPGPKAETEFARIRPTNSLGPDFAWRGRPTSRCIPVKKKRNFKDR
ncbi:hypothetical protein GQ55_1G248700 [Panicum hallii var. hallii]|uniref:Uncharacterized protein n=1 Tax=Panicum hallii var. hallii TaxID=1504633 RepID=A0A2T7F761_9POAL|nr:hypothetical protein GQ55_1G248700 [Panicum hallii var. hallii]